MNDADNLKVKRNLTALVEFSRIINSSFNLDFILNNILLTCMGKFIATKGIIAINMNGKLKLLAHKGISEDKINGFPQLIPVDSYKKKTDLKSYLSSINIIVAEDICSSQKCLGVIGLGEKLNKTAYTDEDLEFLKTILNISATAIQNSLVINELQQVNRQLDSRIHRLSALFELSKEFGLFSESSRVAKLLIYSIIGQFLVSKFAVVIFKGKTPEILESKFNEEQLLNFFNKYDLTNIKTPLKKDEIIKEFPGVNNQIAELIVPMQLQGITKGLILLGKRMQNQEYTEADLEFIYSVGSLAIISLENKRLFQEALEMQKLEEELEIARDIQRNLLPQKIPEYSSFDLAAVNVSSRQVGGDYYDIIKLSEDKFCIAIGDVSGKGVPAALLMANLQAFLKTTCKQLTTGKSGGIQLNEATELINDLISENTSDGKFITFFWGILDNKTRELTYVNAGHNHPLFIRNGEIFKLDKGGIILGVMKTMFPYIKETIQLEKDDVIILFTDGISEALNKKGEEFSDERLENLALQLYTKTSSEILTSIQKEVEKFNAGTIQSDDITLLVIKVK